VARAFGSISAWCQTAMSLALSRSFGSTSITSAKSTDWKDPNPTPGHQKRTQGYQSNTTGLIQCTLVKCINLCQLYMGVIGTRGYYILLYIKKCTKWHRRIAWHGVRRYTTMCKCTYKSLIAQTANITNDVNTVSYRRRRTWRWLCRRQTSRKWWSSGI